MKPKTNHHKLIFTFLKSVSLSGIISVAWLSESVIATPKPLATRFLFTISHPQPIELNKSSFLPHQNTIIVQNSSNSEADRLLQEGFQLFQQGTVESLRAALAKSQLPLISLSGITSLLLSIPSFATIPQQIDVRIAQQSTNTDAAEQVLQEGFQLVQQATAESLRQAISKFEQAVILYRQAGDKGSEALSLLLLGRVHEDLGEKQKALEYYNQALPLIRAVGDREREATTLNNIGSVYDSLGEKQKALEYYNQALPLSRALGDRYGEAATLNNIGVVYDSLGEKQKALDYYNQTLPLIRAVGDRRGEASTLTGIGLVYDSLGEKQQALDYYNQALPLIRAVGDKGVEARILNNIALVYGSMGEKQQALDYLKQALPLSRAVGDREMEAKILTGIGVVYYLLGEKQQALDNYNQALPLIRAVGDRGSEASTLNNIGGVYESLGEKQQALNYLNQALPLSQAVGERDVEARILSNFAHVKRSQGNLTAALTDIESAIKVIEDLRTKIGSQELRQSYFAQNQDYYQFYIDLLMELHQQNPTQGYNAQALHISERARARSLLELLTEANANLRQGVDPQLLAKERNLQQKLNDLEHSRYELTSGQYSETELTQIKQKIDNTLSQLDQLKAQIRITSPRYANLKYPQPLNLEQIQQQVLDDDTILLEYSLGKDRSYLWAVTKNSIDSYELPKQSDIETAAQTFRESLTSSGAKLETGIPLSQILLAPVANQIGNKRLLIVGDGVLQYIPFAALPIPTSPPAP
ncbi:MAG TPA: hypothetical protein DEP38_18550, partial [Cyanobacteria bacterium UBA9226]|nr:hypothetical protein [Cyanobacteria bacterium UBA9226]